MEQQVERRFELNLSLVFLLFRTENTKGNDDNKISIDFKRLDPIGMKDAIEISNKATKFQINRLSTLCFHGISPGLSDDDF